MLRQLACRVRGQGIQAHFGHGVGRRWNTFDGLARSHSSDVHDRARFALSYQLCCHLTGQEEDSAVQVEEVVVILQRVLDESFRVVDTAELTIRSMSLWLVANFSISARTLTKSVKSTA